MKKHVFWWLAHGKPTKNTCIYQLLDEKDVKPRCFHRLLPENATQTPCFIDFCMQKCMKRNVFIDFRLIRCWDQPLWSYDWSQIIKFIFLPAHPGKPKTISCVKCLWKPATVMDVCPRSLWRLTFLLSFAWSHDVATKRCGAMTGHRL